ncbi:MAG: glycosyltransferase [Candidatus Xenobiia bacterium LiM19]
MELHIVIPVYNEKDSIIKTLEEIEKSVKTSHDITIVYDFDEDNTVPAVQEYSRKNSAISIYLLKNDYGKGVVNALKKGLHSVKDGACLVVMADFSDDFRVVDTMAEKIEEGYDVVCGSRYMKGGAQIGGPWLKKLMTRTAGVSLHILTGINTHDITNSFKMYSASLLNSVTIESTGGFEIGLEILVKAFAMGRKITEVPSTWRDRTAGESRFRIWAWLPHYLHWYFYAIKFRWFGIKPESKG